MESPQEIEVWYVLPALRKALAEEMLKLGMTQKDIAVKLHVTESAISQYIKSKRATEMKFPADIKKMIAQSAKRISAHDSGILKETQTLCNQIRSKDLLCKLHKRHSKADLKNCKVCGK